MRVLLTSLTCLLFLLLGIALAQWLPARVESRLPTLLIAKDTTSTQPGAATAVASPPPPSATAKQAQAADARADVPQPASTDADAKPQPAVLGEQKRSAATGPESEPDQAPPADPAKTPPRYRLLGIITASGNPPQRSALIAWVGQAHPPARYAAGDELPDGAQLKEITSRSITLAYKLQNYTLKLRDQPALSAAYDHSLLPKPRPAQPIAPTASAPPTIIGFNPAAHADPQAAFQAWYADVQQQAKTWAQNEQPGKAAGPP